MCELSMCLITSIQLDRKFVARDACNVENKLQERLFHITQKIFSWNFTESSVNRGHNGIFYFFIIILWTNKVHNFK